VECWVAKAIAEEGATYVPQVVQRVGVTSEGDLEISDPDEQCLFVQALRQLSLRR
jgi:hypothetical protein